MTRTPRGIGIALALLAFAACTSDDGSDQMIGASDSAETADATTPSATEPPATESPVQTAAEPDPEPTLPDNGVNPLGGDSPEDGLMPSVVCMNLQEAQDEIQDHGVFLSGSEDATGQDRMQINDSNWLVVAQTPDAGVPIGEGDAVLYVVKYDDDYPTPC